MRYRVGWEARNHNAIGLFYHESREVEASNPEEARLKVFDILHSEGYETRFPIVVVPLKAKPHYRLHYVPVGSFGYPCWYIAGHPWTMAFTAAQAIRNLYPAGEAPCQNQNG